MLELIKAIGELVTQIGIPAVVICYFLYKDYLFTNRSVDANERIAQSLALINKSLSIHEGS